KSAVSEGQRSTRAVAKLGRASAEAAIGIPAGRLPGQTRKRAYVGRAARLTYGAVRNPGAPMPSYTAPLRDMRFVLFELLRVQDELKAMPRHADLDRETIDAVLEEAGRFASQVAFPLYRAGDVQG